MDKSNYSYKSIESFIKANYYTWTVEKVLEEYKKYKNGYYVSYTMKHIIENKESDIKSLLDEL